MAQTTPLDRQLERKLAQLPERVRERCECTIARYRQVLPERELSALVAWFTTFYPFQLAWLLEPARHAVKNKARQTGMSHTSAACAVLWGAFHGELTTIISKSDDASKETFLKAKRHQKLLVKLGSKMAEATRDISGDLEFRSGGRVKSRPSTGAQGDTGNVIIDEFAYHEHPQETWDRAAAAATHGVLRLRVLSTPNGTGNKFHELVSDAVRVEDATDSDGVKTWVLHRTDVYKAIEQGMPIDIDACWAKANNDPRTFDQMYRCSFLDGSLQYIPSPAVAAATVDRVTVNRSDQWFAGLDIGRDNDLTVLIVVSFNGITATVHAVRSAPRTNSELLQRMVDWGFSTFPIRRLCVDSTGLGTFAVDDMQRRHGRKVEGVLFGERSKEELATILYDAFCGSSGQLKVDDGRLVEPRGWVKIPATDSVLDPRLCEPGSAAGIRDDVCSIRRIITAAGNVRYDAPRTAKGHADRAWALALALHAINNRPARVWQ